MSKVIILGTDLHGDPTELASKTVLKLKKLFPEHKILSIEHRKTYKNQKGTSIIPKLSKNSRIRRIFQAILLPLYLLSLRMEGYNRLFTFWVANSKYHQILFKFSKILGFNIVFTIISGEDTNFSSIASADVIVCQSDWMFEKAKKALPNNKIKLIYPSINLNLFKPSSKENIIVIPSIPYSVSDFSERGIDFIINFLEKQTIKSTLIFRSKESYEFVKSKNLKNVTLVNKDLSDKELSSILSKAKIMPLVYKSSPDMPLSAIEGLSSGCALICANNLGISPIIQKNQAGIVIRSKEELEKAIKKIISNPVYNKNARKTAEKYFKEMNMLQYKSL